MTFTARRNKRASFPAESVNFANASEIYPFITVVAVDSLDSPTTTRKSEDIVERRHAKDSIEVKERP